jgi:hypothetical protein
MINMPAFNMAAIRATMISATAIPTPGSVGL